jgi:hypothetical protein
LYAGEEEIQHIRPLPELRLSPIRFSTFLALSAPLLVVAAGFEEHNCGRSEPRISGISLHIFENSVSLGN